MRTITLLGAALLALLVAAAAGAGEGSWVECGTTKTGEKTINPGENSCYEIDATDNNSMSKAFNVEIAAKVCLDPDTATDGADAAEVMILYCPPGFGGTPSDEVCFDILDAPLTGATGAADTQNVCKRVGPGAWWIEVTTAPAAGDNAVISVQGE